jgi:hypothetical protein
MEPTDLTIEILKSIHTEVRGVREEGRATNARLDEVVDRVERLQARQVETEIRLATEIVGVAGAVRELRDLFSDDLSVRHEVRDLQHRVGVLETRGR